MLTVRKIIAISKIYQNCLHTLSEKPKYSGYGYHGGGRKATGLKRVSFSVSCQPEELERLKELVAKSGKTTSRYLLDLAFSSDNLTK